ncbi:MAG TPA: sulfatase-like hydrolase/transferase, partial [Polyangiaceae bacterium]|nr:sulfatase-like hydrolase/transferase [Polyangiaceae bacterium]
MRSRAGSRSSFPDSSRAAPREQGALGAVLYGSLASLLVLLLELLLVLVARRAEISSIWEVQNGAALLLPAYVALSVVGGATGGLLLQLLLRAERSRPHRIMLGLLVATAAALGAFGVGGGRHLAAPGLRLGFALGVAGIACAASLLTAGRLSSLLRRAPRTFAGAAALSILGLEAVNQLVLVRLYPAFHIGLAALCLVLAPAVLVPLVAQRSGAGLRRDARSSVLVGLSLGLLAALAALLARPAAQRLARFDNLRLILLESAPLAAQVVTFSAMLAPPEPLDETGDAALASALGGAGPSALNFQGRDLLLVTIDALRADHVGAYGYARKLTPHFDALAAQGSLFERAYCPTPHTSYSVSSLLTGKYLRPLLMQGAGGDSDTWAGLLRTYGYRTAAFYPPAVFFIDQNRFASFEQRALDFEYRWVEFAEGEKRLTQVRDYLSQSPRDKPLFVWVHLFGPHEPYEAHPELQLSLGDRDIDRYDAEVAAADATLGELTKMMAARGTGGVTIVSADHGEEFGDHGGRYHGSSVYEEQVRVPLVIAGPGVKAQRLSEVVQTIDLLPTVLSALAVPRPPRIRGRDLGDLLAGKRASGPGMAYAETDEQALYAEGPLRLLCARRLGACKLFDLEKDPGQTRDASADHPEALTRLRAKQRELGASHGRFEQSGLRAEGKGWPAAILRGAGGDGDAAEEIAALLEDADAGIRKKAAELLFELKRKETAPALRLALSRAEDEDVRRYAALGLTRLGEGAPLTVELLKSPELHFRRLAALALGESGDKRGEELLVAWWRDERERDFQRSREICEVFGALRTKDAVVPLMQSLSDVRLRPYIAQTLGKIRDEAAAGALLSALNDERMQSTRGALASALADLDAGPALATPLVRFLGVPDPLPGGLLLAQRAKILEHIGGPVGRDAARLMRDENLGVKFTVTIPPGGNGKGVRLIVRVRNQADAPGTLLFSRGVDGAVPPKRTGL